MTTTRPGVDSKTNFSIAYAEIKLSDKLKIVMQL